jgi:hydroxymethylbilane synthase
MRRGWRVGTRSSPLALAQAAWVVDQWALGGTPVTVVPIESEGDRVLDRSLDEIGGRGVFTTALEEALVDGRVDLVVHSLKDLPTRLAPSLQLAAVTRREDPRDAAVLRRPGHLDALPAGARVGTSSLRRAALLRQAYPDLVVAPVRGNLGTRLAKLAAGDYDALVLAAAGLVRLGRAHDIADYLDPSWMIPSPGQGALAVEVRADDLDAVRLASSLDDAEVHQATHAERQVLDAMGGNCQIPLGAYAERDPSRDEWQLLVFAAGGGAPPARLSWRGTALDVGVAWVTSELVRWAAADRRAGAEETGGQR